MYRLIKARGYDATVSIENMDTKATVIIGIAKIEIINILVEYGYEYPAFQEEWDMEVNSEAAKKLAALALSMKKPIRDQRKKKEEPTEEKRIGVEVDAFDLIYGIS